jgi:hypothetical protein
MFEPRRTIIRSETLASEYDELMTYFHLEIFTNTNGALA